jgi:hypothetical protein
MSQWGEWQDTRNMRVSRQAQGDFGEGWELMTAAYANALEAVAAAARIKICPYCDDDGYIVGEDEDRECTTCHGLDREERIDAALQALDSLRGQTSGDGI